MILPMPEATLSQNIAEMRGRVMSGSRASHVPSTRFKLAQSLLEQAEHIQYRGKEELAVVDC